MNSLFKSDGRSITRKMTGATFRLNIIPIEFSDFNFSYENPNYGLKFGYLAFFLIETIELTDLKFGKVIQQPLCTGVILESGKLRKLIQGSHASLNDGKIVDEIVADIYELMSEFFLSDFAGIFDLRKAGVIIRIFEVETSVFNRTIADERDNFSLGPEAILRLQAKLIFPV